MEDNPQVKGNFKSLGVNLTADFGSFLLEDCSNFSQMSPAAIQSKTLQNYCTLMKELLALRKLQKDSQEADALEFDKPVFNVVLPDPQVVLPREKPIPKPKALTKWEKFRIEKGIPAKRKRSRMVYDPVSKDWVPRHGFKSVKQVQEKHEWVMPDKGEAVDPFTKKREEKRLGKEKEKLKQMKNQIRGSSKEEKGQVKQGKKELKHREKAILSKSLQLAQLSTASMGKFDKKVSKKEADAPKSLKIKKKQSSPELARLDTVKGAEKDRNLKILNLIHRKEELRGGPSKADAHLDVEKMVKRQKRKEEKARKKQKK